MAKFMLLIRGPKDGWMSLSPEEMQREMQRYIDWSNTLRSESGLEHASQLGDQAAVVYPTGSAVSSKDGPFAETKEAIGGYWIIEAADAHGAVAVAEACPGRDRGLYLEVYPLI